MGAQGHLLPHPQPPCLDDDFSHPVLCPETWELGSMPLSPLHILPKPPAGPATSAPEGPWTHPSTQPTIICDSDPAKIPRVRIPIPGSS